MSLFGRFWGVVEELSWLKHSVANVIEVEGTHGLGEPLPDHLHPFLTASLESLGIRELYHHQIQSLDHAQAGLDVAVVTGTGSGKTLCFNLPVLNACLKEPAATALYLYPTKALAQDQLAKLLELDRRVRAATYDGDTPKSQRPAIRKSAQVVLTNPDMLHVAVLPGHELWGRFLRRLRYVVVDEMHAYQGVFGSHVSCILRRLLRLCEWYGSRPQVIACSATIGNPVELFRALTGREPQLVADDSAPRGARHIVLVRGQDPEDPQSPRPNFCSAQVLVECVDRDLRAMAFNRARVSTELVLRTARDLLAKNRRPTDWVESYRGGYTAEERRGIESDLFAGRLRGLVTTSAMELGVDVGGLDVVVLNGYPGSVSSFWQQCGRAGRGGREGVALMLAHPDPLEQFLVEHPEYLRQGAEPVLCNPHNRYVVASHLRCASFERSLAEKELTSFGEGAKAVAQELADSGDLGWSAERWFYLSRDSPAAKFGIRGTGGKEVRLVAEGELLGTMEHWRAMRNAHPGAVYLHRGQTYRVENLDLESGTAWLQAADVRYYTEPIQQSVVEPGVPISEARHSPYVLTLMGLHVTTVVVGYRVKSLDGGTVLEEHELEMPPVELDTVGVRLDLPGGVSDAEDAAFLGSVHGMQHALWAVAPHLAGCDRNDLESAWYVMCPDTFGPAIYVYDTTPGGVGLSERLFSERSAWADMALKLVTTCACAHGCPRCLYSSRCEVANDLLDKPRATEVLTQWAQSMGPKVAEPA